MPASTRTDNGAPASPGVTDADAHGPGVTDHLDMALTVARDQGMSAAELMGLLFYYAHSVAEGYRQDALREVEETAGEPGGQT